MGLAGALCFFVVLAGYSSLVRFDPPGCGGRARQERACAAQLGQSPPIVDFDGIDGAGSRAWADQFL